MLVVLVLAWQWGQQLWCDGSGDVWDNSNDGSGDGSGDGGSDDGGGDGSNDDGSCG
jgi:hypothetical protein